MLIIKVFCPGWELNNDGKCISPANSVVLSWKQAVKKCTWLIYYNFLMYWNTYDDDKWSIQHRFKGGKGIRSSNVNAVALVGNCLHSITTPDYYNNVYELLKFKQLCFYDWNVGSPKSLFKPEAATLHFNYSFVKTTKKMDKNELWTLKILCTFIFPFSIIYFLLAFAQVDKKLYISELFLKWQIKYVWFWKCTQTNKNMHRIRTYPFSF